MGIVIARRSSSRAPTNAWNHPRGQSRRSTGRSRDASRETRRTSQERRAEDKFRRNRSVSVGTLGVVFIWVLLGKDPRGRNGSNEADEGEGITERITPDILHNSHDTLINNWSIRRERKLRCVFAGSHCCCAHLGQPSGNSDSHRNPKESSRNRPLTGANVNATLARVIYSFLAWSEVHERAAQRPRPRQSPGAARCQRGGSNDDLYPLLPVLLPTRDNTNHYHRLITGITANIEIMRACVCAAAIYV